MNNSKLWWSILLFVVIFLVSSNIFAEDPWVLLHKGKGSDRDVYYNKTTIQKIDDNVMEVYISVIFASNKSSIQQMRLDCKNNKLANGMSDAYINNAKTQSFDFSKAGWIWNMPRTSLDKKMLRLICKKK